jgi:YegS/Rv2252/BmrU family lipid kinase
MRSGFLAVLNPAAGFGRCGKLATPALEKLRAAGLEIEVAQTERAGHAVDIARAAYRNGYRKFIAVGGDGTSFEIVNGLFPEAAAGDPPTLAMLPLGSGNSFLRDFTDNGAEYSTQALIEGRSRPCDVVRLTHKEGVLHFINILSLGFVADVCTMANRRFKWMGEAGYALAVVLCLARFRRGVFPMRVDGAATMDRSRTALLIFNNSKYTGGKMMLAPDADTSDGLIEIVRWSVGRFGFLANFPKVYDGSHITHRDIWHGPAKRVDFDLPGPIDIMIDGEVLTTHCESLEVLPSALRVMV